MWVSASSVSSASRQAGRTPPGLAVTPSVHAHTGWLFICFCFYFFNFITCSKLSMSDLSRICNLENCTEWLFSFWLDTL